MVSSTMKYTAINIGPIISTLSMARKPRELWAASYMFSYLMKCIVDNVSKEHIDIVSPAKLTKDADRTIGLYPDRLFIKGELKEEILEKSFNKFANDIGLDIQKTRDYFNLMSVTVEFEDKEKGDIITRLNRLLDRMELCNLNVNEKARIEVQNYLAEYSCRLENVIGKRLKKFSSIETIASIDIFDGESKSEVIDKSDKYICIVQADGDCMGNVVSNCPIEKVSELSQTLLSFGQASCQTIREYGGLPIYAGGDDLLFFAPVLTSKGSIFDLIDELDKHYMVIQQIVDDYKIKDKKGRFIHTSMSYGLSITYRKYPLYEALPIARDALFNVAKNVEGKNAVAWALQKHSGSSYKVSLSKNRVGLYNALKEVIRTTESEQLISAVAHKLLCNEVLLSLWLGEPDEKLLEQRINNFFNKIIDIESKMEAAVAYINSVKALLLEVYKLADMDEIESELDGDNKRKLKLEKMRPLIRIVYSMLRTAKFVKGKEEDK